MTHVHEDLGAYALGSLDGEGAARVSAHLDDCPQCAEAYAEIAGLPKLLDLGVVASAAEEEPLPPALEERLLDRFAREHESARRPERRWRPRLLLGGGVLTGAAIAAALLIGVLGMRTQRTVPEATYRLALLPVAGAPASATARAALHTVPGGTVVRLWAHNLPGRAGDVYEVLCQAKGWSASAGTFRVDAKGNAVVVLTTAAKRGEYDSIRVVRESGGRSSPVLDGKLA